MSGYVGVCFNCGESAGIATCGSEYACGACIALFTAKAGVEELGTRIGLLTTQLETRKEDVAQRKAALLERILRRTRMSEVTRRRRPMTDEERKRHKADCVRLTDPSRTCVCWPTPPPVVDRRTVEITAHLIGVDYDSIEFVRFNGRLFKRMEESR